MFNWTTTTIINDLKDLTTGKDLVKVWTSAEGVEGAEGKAGFSGSYPVLKIKRDHTFEARYITKIYKAEAQEPKLCEMKIDLAKLLEAVKPEDDAKVPNHVRLAFYIALEGSEESIYANDWYQKGKPFSIGFEVSAKDDKDSLAKKILKNVDKFSVAIYGKKVFDLKKDGDSLVLSGTHEYQRFKMAAAAIDDSIDEVVVAYFADGEESEDEVFSLEERGSNGFGTYAQLIKDLRLPTAHNTKWLRLKEDEKPVVGGKYNQYILTYCAPSMANPGFTVVGQHNMSVTTHVFWVNAAIATDFEEALGDIADSIETVSFEKAEADAGTKYSVNHEQEISHPEAETANP